MKRLMKIASVAAIAAASGVHAAPSRGAGKATYVGSGIAFPTLNHSLIVNPAGLVSSPRASLQGGYLVDPQEYQGSLTAGMRSFGLGAGYRTQGESSVEEFGLAVRLGKIDLGAVMNSSDFEGFDGDVGVIIPFGSFRLAGVARDVTDGIDRLDFGIAKSFGEITLEFDAKKPVYDGDKTWLFDAALSANSGRISAGVGYTFWYDGEAVLGGDFHAGLSLEIVKGLAAEFFYKPAEQEWAPGDWVVGGRYVF